MEERLLQDGRQDVDGREDDGRRVRRVLRVAVALVVRRRVGEEPPALVRELAEVLERLELRVGDARVARGGVVDVLRRQHEVRREVHEQRVGAVRVEALQQPQRAVRGGRGRLVAVARRGARHRGAVDDDVGRARRQRLGDGVVVVEVEPRALDAVDRERRRRAPVRVRHVVKFPQLLDQELRDVGRAAEDEDADARGAGAGHRRDKPEQRSEPEQLRRAGPVLSRAYEASGPEPARARTRCRTVCYKPFRLSAFITLVAPRRFVAPAAEFVLD
mmetsp:Transcript_14641/g.45356  ORF Transcript_14641/g.45356 Transcript_14641/m.45356 type:complete len:274 (-) Transcript_14641:1381-2202(-)